MPNTSKGESPSWNRKNAAFSTLEHCRQQLRDALLETRTVRTSNSEQAMVILTERLRRIQISIDMHWENISREALKGRGEFYKYNWCE